MRKRCMNRHPLRPNLAPRPRRVRTALFTPCTASSGLMAPDQCLWFHFKRTDAIFRHSHGPRSAGTWPCWARPRPVDGLGGLPCVQTPCLRYPCRMHSVGAVTADISLLEKHSFVLILTRNNTLISRRRKLI